MTPTLVLKKKDVVASSFERWVGYALLMLTALTFVMQTGSIAVFPIANATRWFSDETWVMEEAQSQIETGVVTYPHARASSLTSAKGMLLGTPWISSVLYGLPITLSPQGSDIVLIGRVVTLVLTFLTAFLLYYFARRLGASMILSAFGPLLMVGSRASFITSHCARPDVLAGLVVLLVVGYFSLLRKRGFVPKSNQWWFVFGLVMMGLAWTSSIHLLTLLGPLAIFLMYSFGAFRKPGFFFGALAGALTMALVLGGIYTLTTAHALASGNAPHEVQFDKIILQTPILRPFSRSVQVANILIRVKLLWAEAPGVFALIIAAKLALIAACAKTRSLKFFTPTEKFLIGATIAVLLSWLFFQLASQTYTMHVLPLIVLLMLVLLQSTLRQLPRLQRSFEMIAVLGGIIGFIFAMNDAETAKASATSLDRESKQHLGEIMTRLQADHVGQSSSKKPLIVAETPFVHQLALDTSVSFLTDHFTGFRTTSDNFLTTMRNAGVSYILLFNSDHYPKNRYTDDQFFKEVTDSCKRIATASGELFDMNYSYFDTNYRSIDSVLLYKMP